MEKRAEIAVDERHRQRIDSLRGYFDENLSKLLIGTVGDTDKIQALAREISAHRVLIDKQAREIDMLIAERDGLLSNLRFHKSQGQDLACKVKEL